MNRRTFVWTPLIISLGSVFNLDARPDIVDVSGGLIKAEIRELLASFTHLSDAAEVGQKYLSDYDEPIQIDQLIRAIGQTDLGSDRMTGQARDHFEEAKRQDFTTSNTVCLDGWVLSKAEASLCALAYLSPLTV